MRELREAGGFSQRVPAVYLHVTQPMCSDYERGKVNLPIDVLKKLALLYKTSANYLLELTDDPTPPPRSGKTRE